MFIQLLRLVIMHHGVHRMTVHLLASEFETQSLAVDLEVVSQLDTRMIS
jgi:hypothetical protein